MASGAAGSRDPLRAFGLDGEVAIVTGGGAGIGLAIAEAMAAVGARVAIVDRKADTAVQAAEAIGRRGGVAAAYALDITDAAATARTFATIAERQKRLDILVNSAGLAIRKPAVDLTPADWQPVVDVNLTGLFFASREAAKHMIAGGRGGRIVNIASMMGLSGGGLYPNASYQATKGAVVNLTRALAIEWAKEKVRVNAIAPTYVRTGFIGPLLKDPALVAKIEAMTPLGRLADPADIVGAALYLASAASAMVTGHTLAVDGGFLAQ
ncbi:MAG: glucose 1-dehydrogenase [Alphaproteobacteria bacterium]|nr:glucose 1-dehydrogenase [Alphaproteobacteria bacterium]